VRRWLPMLLCVHGCTTDGVPASSADDWLGRWNGPEGTYLDIAGANGTYQITVKDLDRARTFSGSGVGDGIEFRRDGVNEMLRATDGDATGGTGAIQR
jgi:hypothetical protein